LAALRVGEIRSDRLQLIADLGGGAGDECRPRAADA
jgi:hypothetical protein